MPVSEALPLPSGLGSVLAEPGAALQEIEHLLTKPFMEAAKAMPSGGDALQRAVQSIFQRSTPSPSGDWKLACLSVCVIQLMLMHVY